tara:strand:- start:105 stop:575 length:471 start_codon:yes stop_codon:yes gene_type:complete
LLEGSQNTPDEGIGERNTREVVLHSGLPLTSLPEACEISGFPVGEVAAGFRDVGKVFFGSRRQDNLVEGIQVQVFAGNIPWEMGMEDPAGEEEGLLVIALVEGLEVVDRVIGYSGIVIAALRLRENSPVCFAGIEFDSGVGKIGRAWFRISPGIEG